MTWGGGTSPPGLFSEDFLSTPSSGGVTSSHSLDSPLARAVFTRLKGGWGQAVRRGTCLPPFQATLALAGGVGVEAKEVPKTRRVLVLRTLASPLSMS